MKAASPRGSVSLGAVACELMKTMPCARGSPLDLAPRGWGRRAGCAVCPKTGLPEGFETSPRRRSERSGAPREMYFFACWFFGGFCLFARVDKWGSSGLRKYALGRRDEGGLGSPHAREMAASRRPPCRTG